MQWQYIVTKRTEERVLTPPVTADFKLEESLQPMYVHSLQDDLGMSFTRGDSPKDVINSVYDWYRISNLWKLESWPNWDLQGRDSFIIP